MKKYLITILGILNLIVAGSAVIYLCAGMIVDEWDWYWGFPTLIVVIVNLTAGIFALRWRVLGCAFAGLAILGVVIIYFLVLFWILRWP